MAPVEIRHLQYRLHYLRIGAPDAPACNAVAGQGERAIMRAVVIDRSANSNAADPGNMHTCEKFPVSADPQISAEQASPAKH